MGRGHAKEKFGRGGEMERVERREEENHDKKMKGEREVEAGKRREAERCEGGVAGRRRERSTRRERKMNKGERLELIYSK